MFEYDGSAGVTAYLSGCTPGQAYTLAFSGDGPGFSTRTARYSNMTLRAVVTTLTAGDPFTAEIYKPPTVPPILTHDLTYGTAELVPDPTMPEGIVVALADGPLESDPTWTRLDDPAQPWRVQSWSVNVGRNAELDRTDPGSATIVISDRDGSFDLTNPAGLQASGLAPGRQAGILMHDPVTNTWHWRFRGFVVSIDVDVYPNTKHATVTITLGDALDWLNRIEMSPSSFGDPVPAGSEGDIYYPATTTALEVSERMHDVLDTIGWPVDLRRLFTGNVQLQATVYARRDQAATVLEDAADAEFPDVANLYAAKDGMLTFHGRLARFDPESYSSADDLSRANGNSICFWSAVSGDITADYPNVALIHALSYRMSRDDLINDALALPKDVDETDVPGNRVDDSTSQAAYGTNSVSFPDLLVLSGPAGSTAVQQTLKYGQYYVDNYKDPRVRITSLSFTTRLASEPFGPGHWAFLCGVDIGDVLTVTTHHFDGSMGFAEDYFVERIEMQVEPARPEYDLITLTLDVSPRAFYDVNPF